MPEDIVCGMGLKQESAKEKIDHEGQTYYFCSPVCKTEFERNPNKYLKKKNLISRFINWLGSGSSGKRRSCH